MRPIRRLGAVAALIVLLVRPSDLSSCGPFFRAAVFFRAAIPEDEKAFFSGQLGILQPTYWRRYLAMAYRILQGIPLSPAEVASIPPRQSVGWEPESQAAGKWKAARMKVPGTTEVVIEEYRSDEDWTHVKNCNDDAFLTAVATLNERIRQAGAGSAEVKDWLAAQDMVFANCKERRTTPDPAPPGNSPRVVADRNYQIAAADFYAGDYREAKSEFMEIAADKASPWHTMAPYLAVRADLRAENYQEAQAELKAILADPNMAPIHARAEALRGFAEAKLDPEGWLASCTGRLLLRNSPTLGRDLVDYTFLYDKLHNEQFPNDDVSVWIRDFREGSENQLVKRWQQNPSLPWLIAALHYAKRDSDHSDELIEAARQVRFDSPAWPTAKFHAIRLLNDKGKRREARVILNEITSRLKGASVSMTNAFRAEQLLLAGSFEEFLLAAPRTAAGEQLTDNSAEWPPSSENALTSMFDTDASVAFSYLPLNLWLAATQDVRVPKRLRTLLAQSGFTRAAVLDDPIAADMAQLLRDLKPAYKADMDRYLAAPQESRRFEAVLWIGHHPEASIDVRAGLPRGLNNDTPDGSIDDYHDN
jgi:hypothetical protein